jgi:hypothetical protein
MLMILCSRRADRDDWMAEPIRKFDDPREVTGGEIGKIEEKPYFCPADKVIKDEGDVYCKSNVVPAESCPRIAIGAGALILIIVSFLMLIIAAVLNHLVFSFPGEPYFVLPFFGEIIIDRRALYDISLILFVGAPVVMVLAFILRKRRKGKKTERTSLLLDDD